MKHRHGRNRITAPVLTLFIVLTLVLSLSGCSRRVEYSIDYVQSHCENTKYSILINVKIPKLKSNPVHTEEINKEFSDYYLDIYNNFKAELVDRLDKGYVACTGLTLYGVCGELDDFLCVTVFEQLHGTAPTKISVKSTFLDLKEDKLYNTEEYMKKVGITPPNMDFIKERYGEDHNIIWIKTNGLFFLNGEPILVIQFYTEDEDCLPAEFKHTTFYNCNTGGWAYITDIDDDTLLWFSKNAVIY